MELHTRILCSFLNFFMIQLVSINRIIGNVEGYSYPVYTDSRQILKELTSSILKANSLLQPMFQQTSPAAESKVVFPIPEDIVMNRSYLPDLGFLTDFAFLFMPKGLPASGLVRLSRDLFESEQCVQYVSCEMTKISQKHRSLQWIQNFLQDFPFQGDVAERILEGTTDAISKLNKRKQMTEENELSAEYNTNYNNKNGNRKKREDELCTFSCHPISSLSKGLKILGLLHSLVRTIR